MRVEGSEDRIRVVEEGVVVDVREGRDLRHEMAYGNHHSVNKHKEKVLNEAVGNPAWDRATAFRANNTCRIERLCGSVVGDGGGKYQASCYPRSNIRRSDRGGSGEGRQRSVSADIEWEKIPGCNLGEVLYTILKHILGLRAKIGVR